MPNSSWLVKCEPRSGSHFTCEYLNKAYPTYKVLVTRDYVNEEIYIDQCRKTNQIIHDHSYWIPEKDTKDFNLVITYRNDTWKQIASLMLVHYVTRESGASHLPNQSYTNKKINPVFVPERVLFECIKLVLFTKGNIKNALEYKWKSVHKLEFTDIIQKNALTSFGTEISTDEFKNVKSPYSPEEMILNYKELYNMYTQYRNENEELF